MKWNDYFVLFFLLYCNIISYDRKEFIKIEFLCYLLYFIIKSALNLCGSISQNWETYDPINLKPIQKGVFPIKKRFNKNSVKLDDERIVLIGGLEYDFSVWDGMPYACVSKSCQLFDIVTSVENPKLIPGHYDLFQNYPNPFNPTTKISFTIPEKGNVKLRVFDVLGREITLLADGIYEAGKYEVTFNASNLPSGVYFYNLTTGNGSITKKMLLLK